MFEFHPPPLSGRRAAERQPPSHDMQYVEQLGNRVAVQMQQHQ